MKLDFKMNKIFVAVLALLLFSSLAKANETTVSATGGGSCSTAAGCNNFNTLVLDNTLAGEDIASIYSDWFAFNIPTLSGGITSATINIFDSFVNTGNAFYNLYIEPGVVNSANIAVGTYVGSTFVSSTLFGGSYASVGLNSAGLALLNTSEGGQVFFAGNVTNYIGSPIYVFGGPPVAPVTLDLVTANLTTTPEPSSLLLFCTGLLGLGGVVRRKLLS